MKLTEQQLLDLERDGFTVIKSLFSEAEVQAFREETTRLIEVPADYTGRETGGDVRAIYRVHEDYGPTQSAECRALARSPRLLESAQQVLEDDEVYIFHTKINVKPGITGGIWSWHQDYGRWQTDGVPRDDMYTWVLMLDETEEISGAVYMIPGSHKLGVQPHVDDPGLGALNSYAVHKEDMKRILRSGRKPVAIVGPPGTAVLFHANVLHSSGHNLSAGERRQIYIVYNAVANEPRMLEKPRPDHLCSTNRAPLSMGTDDDILAAAGQRAKTLATA